jgi:hypothetical protein
MPTVAAEFFQQAHLFDLHAAIDRLAYVVNSQGGDAGGGQRLHLDAGLPGYFTGGRDAHRVQPLGLQLKLDAAEHQLMTKRNQRGGFLRRLDAGDPRNGKHITFGMPALDDHL